VAITSALPDEKQGVASAVNDTAREVGSAIGIAILGAALTNTYKSEISIVTSKLPAEISDKIERSIGFTQMQPPSPIVDKWDKLVEAGLQAFNSGVQSSLTIAGFVALAGAVFVAVVAPKRVGNSGL
jgi:hypothetical protein